MRAVCHGGWSLAVAMSLLLTACAAEAPVEAPAAQATPGPEEGQPVRAASICEAWNCTSKCCWKFWGIPICEPTCKVTCEAHNLACDPGICQAIRGGDWSYDTLKAQWQLAQRNGAFCTRTECDLLADQGEEGVARVCEFAANPYCGPLNAVANEENHCFCSELDYSSCAPPPPPPPPLECGGRGCCDWDDTGSCTVCPSSTGYCPPIR